jgi:hypothetical protein
MNRRWPGLVGCLMQNPAPLGMLTRNQLAAHGSPGWDAPHLARTRIHDLLGDLETEALVLAAALGSQAMGRDEPLFAIYPTAGNRTPDACCAWRASGGRVFVASSVPLPHLLEGLEARTSLFLRSGRATEYDQPIPGWHPCAN